jgi:hypothetical protein
MGTIHKRNLWVNILIIPPFVGLFTGVIIGVLMVAGPSFEFTRTGYENSWHGLASSPGLTNEIDEFAFKPELVEGMEFDGDAMLMDAILRGGIGGIIAQVVLLFGLIKLESGIYLTVILGIILNFLGI